MRVIQDVHQIDGELRPPSPSQAHVWRDGQWEHDPVRHSELMQKEFQRLSASIDMAADTARREVVGDPLRALEYDRAANDAQVFKDAGYLANAAPRSVAAWAIGERTVRQAADEILREADAYIEVLYCLRETRLQAKEALRSLMAEGDTTAAQRLTDQAIIDIKKIAGGVGNAK
jgi:cytochrome P450